MTAARVQFKVTLECKACLARVCTGKASRALQSEGLYRQPCTPECNFNYCPFVRITINRTLTKHFQTKDYL